MSTLDGHKPPTSIKRGRMAFKSQPKIEALQYPLVFLSIYRIYIVYIYICNYISFFRIYIVYMVSICPSIYLSYRILSYPVYIVSIYHILSYPIYLILFVHLAIFSGMHLHDPMNKFARQRKTESPEDNVQATQQSCKFQLHSLKARCNMCKHFPCFAYTFQPLISIYSSSLVDDHLIVTSPLKSPQKNPPPASFHTS